MKYARRRGSWDARVWGGGVHERGAGTKSQVSVACNHGWMTDITAVQLGLQLLRARRRLGLSQAEVAQRARVSIATVCRMELGRGKRMSLERWMSVALAVDLRLIAALVGHEPVSAPNVVVRCHALVAETARRGGWTAVTQIQTDEVETVLLRPLRREVAVIRAWHVITDVSRAVGSLTAGIARQRAMRDASWRVGGLVVCHTNSSVRRRLTETAPEMAGSLPAFEWDWVRALHQEQQGMPERPGIVWADPGVTRIRPAPRRSGWRTGRIGPTN